MGFVSGFISRYSLLNLSPRALDAMSADRLTDEYAIVFSMRLSLAAVFVENWYHMHGHPGIFAWA